MTDYKRPQAAAIERLLRAAADGVVGRDEFFGDFKDAEEAWHEGEIFMATREYDRKGNGWRLGKKIHTGDERIEMPDLVEIICDEVRRRGAICLVITASREQLIVGDKVRRGDGGRAKP